MPKQIHKIDQFHGGLSSNSDPRDIADNELAVANDVMVDEIGRVRTLGGTADHSSDDGSQSEPTVDIEPGYGLFQFSHDRKGAETTGSGSDSTGDDYLVLADTDATLDIYSRVNNAWGEDIIRLGVSSGMKPCFYVVDGDLRVSDGNFGVYNLNQWYGYIYKTWFSNVGDGYSIDQWYSTYQRIKPPVPSYFDEDWELTTGESGDDFYLVGTDWHSAEGFYPTGEYTNTTKADIIADWVDDDITGSDSIVRVSVTVEARNLGTLVYDLKVGPTDSVSGWNEEVSQRIVNQTLTVGDPPSTESQTHEFFFEHGDTYLPDDWAGAEGNDYFQVQVFDVSTYGFEGNICDYRLYPVILYEGGAQSYPALDSGGSFTNGASVGNNVCMLWDFQSALSHTDTTSGSWVPVENEGKWMVGATFIYDGLQESQLTELVDEEDGSKKYIDINGIPETQTVTARPAVVLAIADPNHNQGTSWNKRITGCNIYIKDIYSSDSGSWYLQYEADFLTGKLTVVSTQSEYDAKYHADDDDQSYYYWFLNTNHSTSPSFITTYEINSGYKPDELSYVQAFKTAVVANRMVYIANVKLENGDILGDAMFKSPVNKFDVFPLSRKIEASVRDGDEIVKLEEYADRILQFKKNKVHIINVSQHIEFLEDTFIRKGVSHPAATCKTDFGIAWVNKHGVYFYDGQKVNNLFEKDGRQIIKESDWDDWQDLNEPMIGYVPKKRQLIIKNDINSNDTDDNDIFLYDMVTRSWVRGTDAFPSIEVDSNIYATNFITDWDGDLVLAYSFESSISDLLSYTNIIKWDDTSDSTDNYELRTKDIDFGQPGQRKKVSKVRISYKGDASNLQVGYSVDGSQSLDYEFNSNLKPLTETTTTDWIHAELTPTTSSLASNIYSFQLHFLGSAGADFEINDISIVYRLKPVK